MAKVYPGDRVRAAKSHPFYAQIKDDEMIVVAVELQSDMRSVKVQTASGPSQGFSDLPWADWKMGWREDDLDLIGSTQTTTTTTTAPVTTITPATPTAKAAAKAAEAATSKVVNA